jgi:hypothetical protein
VGTDEGIILRSVNKAIDFEDRNWIWVMFQSQVF